MKVMIEALRKVITRMHYPLSPRHIEAMMAERGVFVIMRPSIAGR
jgi:transposase-like protein